jgi:hypothetical protein
MLHMGVDKEEVGQTTLAGSLTRQTEQNSSLSEAKGHLAIIGKMIEDMETDIRINLNEIYILKTKEIVNSIRSPKEGPVQSASHTAFLNAAVMNHGKLRKQDSQEDEVV